MSKTFVHRILIVLAFTTAAAGCGERTLAQKKTYPVSGKVTMNGEPVAFATVHFTPKDGKGAIATAFTGADGTFENARTYSNSEMDGAAPGDYEVEVEEYDMVKSLGPRPKAGEKPTSIPEDKRHYGSVVTVEEGGNEVNIDL